MNKQEWNRLRVGDLVRRINEPAIAQHTAVGDIILLVERVSKFLNSGFRGLNTKSQVKIWVTPNSRIYYEKIS